MQGMITNLDNEESIEDTILIPLTWIQAISTNLVCMWQSLKWHKLFPMSELYTEHFPVQEVGTS